MAVLALEEREEDVFVGQTPTTPSRATARSGRPT
jgi:hypothetical protein